MRHDILGYAPIPNSTTTIKKRVASEVIYNVTYTIDDNGRRTSPESNIVSDRCLLFFGGSFTFGEGVNDHEAMPYVVGELAPFRIYNFGVGGCGPHQMLSAIEHGIVTTAADCRASAAIYQALPAHVARSAGYSSWDTRSKICAP